MAGNRVGAARAPRHRPWIVAAIALTIVNAGCGGGNEATPPSDRPATTTAGTDGVVAAELTLPASELIGPVAEEGALWLRNVRTGEVFRIDPKTNKLAATIDVGPGYGLAVGEGAVWATLPDSALLLRIDPASNEVAARIPVGEQPRVPAVAFGSVWVSNHLGGTVSRIDPKTNQHVVDISVATPPISGPRSLGPGGNYMWVGVPGLGEIVRIDPATNSAGGALKIRGAGCHDMATDGATLWLAGGCADAVMPRTVWKVDPEQISVVTTIEPGGDVGPPVFWNGQLWVLTSLNLVTIDPTTDQVRERAAIRGPGGVAVVDGTLWVSSYEKVLRLRLN